MNAIRDYIDGHYMNALSRDAVARRAPNYLSQLFQRADGGGFNHYLNHVRLEQAKTLLKEYEMTIKAIAHACGYDDSNDFCRLFRQRTERTPSEYRRQYHSQRDAP
ncbi:AraC family transcriptional regulator [Edwardsiella anguillarum]|uniref:AraC family transcriptional regulator n=1 Tax=Edwardsiella anguillarum ET080813 TaxID=667120 RepID=A0A076LMT6_9GAMM|nr:AraC family transcriptional regulator [Edwardsiella anguillarum ET080813]BET80147.1 AraC family transcriptional regulator [Edwardsiella anguillarum]GAJ67788.1 putative ARAC-type regulatory protein [Edwardsiella piscicida]BET83436.1 AraC family transcriptional regulator [Edwardsiella anguillarum]BET86803.1 AraC family transcriptional regulator [Edwardsiella anguillarum]